MLAKPPILWKRGAAWLAFLGPFFFLSYGWLNYYTSTRNDVGVVVQAWESQIPFVAWLMLPYMSIDAFYAASLFLFRKKSALDRHALRLLLATVISLIGFWLFPLQFSFEVPKATGFNGALQAILLGFDKPYNQAPSLHIGLLIVLWDVYAKKLNGAAKLALHVWFTATALSVLLVYQHHFIDVWTGALAGVACLYLIPDLPFGLRWQKPTLGRWQLALIYSLAACVLWAIAYFVDFGILKALSSWLGLSLGLVALAYMGFEQLIFQRDTQSNTFLKLQAGKRRCAAKILLLPYLIGAWLSFKWHTRKLATSYEITPNVWLGAYPSHREQKNQPKNWYSVLDLTYEFGTANLAAQHRKFLPVLDLTPASPTVLQRAVCWLEAAQQKGDVLVHCALGLSRSASVVVCWLVWSGRAKNVYDATQVLRQKQPHLVIKDTHKVNIEQALNLLGHYVAR